MNQSQYNGTWWLSPLLCDPTIPLSKIPGFGGNPWNKVKKKKSFPALSQGAPLILLNLCHENRYHKNIPPGKGSGPNRENPPH